jgi:multidrug transporter EmrE-like cation transporter
MACAAHPSYLCPGRRLAVARQEQLRENPMTHVLLALFVVMQVGANLAFRCGTAVPSRWALCFAAGNALGVASIWLLMHLYTRMDANLALVIGGGGTFLAVQCVMAAVFGARLSSVQWLGVAAVGLGMAVAALGGSAPSHISSGHVPR